LSQSTNSKVFTRDGANLKAYQPKTMQIDKLQLIVNKLERLSY